MTFTKFVKKAWRKIYYKIIAFDYRVDRAIRYNNPKQYWNKRGGDTYFQEQEAEQHRTERSKFITDKIKQLDFSSLLEIGCGYGKQLKNISAKKGIRLFGCDFSRPQLLKAKAYCEGIHLNLVEGDVEYLPFQSESFDVSFSSAVILHNHPDKAKRIISELIRVSRKYLAHNEDTDKAFSRYGYDMKKTYEAMGFKIIESTTILFAPDPTVTQFTIAEIPAGTTISAEQINLQYH